MMKKSDKRLISLIILFVLILFGYFFIGRPAVAIKKEGEKLLPLAKKIKADLLKNDFDQLEKDYKNLQSQYQIFQQKAKSLYWLSFIAYGADFKNAVEAGSDYLRAGQLAIESIKPYADLIGFKKGEASFVEKSAEDRLQTAIITLDKMLNRVDEISQNINQGENHLNKINFNRYPKRIGKLVVRDRLEKVVTEVKSVSELFVSAKPLIKNLPTIFGLNQEKTYLILFQNDKELRATGGFLTSYAIFKVKDAKIKIEKSEDIYDLDNSISNHPEAPREILTYHQGVNRFYIRDSNLSPDFPSSIELFEKLYQKSSKKVKYDGIITIDTYVLVDLLKIFGDTEVDGKIFSAKIDKRCDCPSAIYTLFDIVDRPTPYLRENRKGILGRLMYVLFYKALGFSPSRYWGQLISQMLKDLEEKHILVYFNDQELQKAVEALNFAGRIRDYPSDYLHINNVNFAGAKSNMFVNEKIESETAKKGEKLYRKLTITFRNPYPHSDCNLERGGLCLNATLRNWIRIYVPQGSKLLSFKGSEKKVEVYEDLGKTVFEGFLRVTPLGMAKVIVEYELPPKISFNNYSFLIQKQPGTKEQELVVKIDNQTIYKGLFNKDLELKR